MIPLLLFLAADPTYYRDVQPILAAQCTVCHTAGQVAPFALDNYDDAKKHARTIAAVTKSRRMPIWKPDPGIGHFADERRLTDAQINTLVQWAKTGATLGKPTLVASTEPTKPTRAPDLVLEMPTAIDIPASGPDQFICTVIPIPIDEDKWVSKVEFQPGNPRVVHHSLFFLLDRASATKRAGKTGSYPCFGGPGGLPQGALGGWAPGAFPHESAPGSARELKHGLALVMQQHYHPSGKPESDRSRLNVYYAQGPIDKPIHGLAVRTRDIKIKPYDAHHTVKASLHLPVAVSLSGVTPHMHYIGKKMSVTATFPDGRKLALISISDWDFNWQGQYRYAAPIDLPAGARLDLLATYDNSAANPNNPSSPPKEVTWGEQTTNEMALCFFEYTSPEKSAPRRILMSMAKQALLDLF